MFSRNISNIIGIVLIVAGLGLSLYLFLQTGSVESAGFGLVPVVLGWIMIEIPDKQDVLDEFDELDALLDFAVEPDFPAGALLGMGTVVDVERTGVMVNDIPPVPSHPPGPGR
ncbi:hypothetical protein [Corynebacterium sp.]|uniref:hypothetical protein n=1 Tax=Corynebacterium sp. TaxID=1720 RepID=UPI0019A89700|nr:hypothetical protein [Corynebacterium sp.]HHU67310.1 hypothetical protein [Corynebacterium sp.]